MNLVQNIWNTQQRKQQEHLKPLSKIFTEEQLKTIPVDNKVGENYFGHLSQQLRSKGGSAFQAISDRLVLKTSSDLAFGNEGANMLKDKELKAKQKEVHQIEADFSKSQKEIMKAKLALTDSEADKLARDMAKNKLISLCVQNGTKHKYIAPLSSQAEVKKCYDRIKKLSEADQLAILRRKVKLKKALFSEMQNDFSISSSTISQPNRCMKICLLCTQLTHLTKRSLL